MKDKDKVLDAVIFLVFQVLIFVIALIANANTQITNGDVEVSWAGLIFALYSGVTVFTIAGGILAVILAAIKKKVSK